MVKKQVRPIVLLWLLSLGAVWAWADEPAPAPHRLEDVVVKDVGDPVQYTPSGTVIDVEAYQPVGEPHNIVDLLKQNVMIDFTSGNELSQSDDTFRLRGFQGGRFVTALDGLTVQRTGGRNASNIVDYSVLPTFMVEKIEILPGPHSALYDSKSIGGVVNMVSAPPRRRDTLKPVVHLNTSYGSYQTQNHRLTAGGAVDVLTYDLAYQKYRTDGYLRHTLTDSDSLLGRFGVALPNGGYVAVSAAYADVDRQDTVINDPRRPDYDRHYPTVERASYDSARDPIWGSQSRSLRLNAYQPTSIGRLSLGAYTSKDDRDRAAYPNADAPQRSHLATRWWQDGARLQDQFSWHKDHETTLGADVAYLYDGDGNTSKDNRVHKKSVYLQHAWAISDALDLQLGARYENVNIWVSGTSGIPGRPPWVERRWEEVVPKSFSTYKLDDLAPWLRDSSLALGVSKIWRAPDNHGDYNPQGRPSGVYLEPEHGMAYDLVFNRRLFGDIALRVGYGFYEIKDYIAGNSKYAKHNAATDPERYKDYSINLQKVQRHGVDLEFGGHITDRLSFTAGYAWQKFYNKGDELGGDEAVHQRAAHRCNAALRYELWAGTNLQLDYAYQSKEITVVSEKISDDTDPEEIWDFREELNKAYNVFNIGLKQRLFKDKGWLKEAVLGLAVKNLFDENYCDARGYPALDRTYWVSLDVSF